MFSLRTKVEKQFQLRLGFLGLNYVVLKNVKMPVIIEHVENVSPSLRIYLQQIHFKEKVEQVEEQKLSLEVDLQKVKVE